MARKAKAVVAPVELVEEIIEALPVVEVEVEEEVVEQSTGPSLVSMMAEQLVEVVSHPVVEEVKEKNVGVGTFIKNLITEGLGNKEILSIVHEQYGNNNTTYACVAWYRNKMKKTNAVVAKNSALDFVTRFAQMSGASEGEVEVVKAELRKVA